MKKLALFIGLSVVAISALAQPASLPTNLSTTQLAKDFCGKGSQNLGDQTTIKLNGTMQGYVCSAKPNQLNPSFKTFITEHTAYKTMLSNAISVNKVPTTFTSGLKSIDFSSLGSAYACSNYKANQGPTVGYSYCNTYNGKYYGAMMIPG